MSLSQKAVSYALRRAALCVSVAEYDALRVERDAMLDENDVLRRENESLREALDLANRHKSEFFHLIERIEKQRDEWRDMFKAGSVRQLAAVDILERSLYQTRKRLSAAVDKLNIYLKAEGKDPLKDPGPLSDPPAGENKRYAEELQRIYASGLPESAGRDPALPRPADLDGKEERSKILGSGS